MKKILTYTGKLIDVKKPMSWDICIEDIAHALSLQNRFNGVTKYPYSVAQHCVNVAYICGGDEMLNGLMHDASEAYIRDLPVPVKDALPDYRKLEAKWTKVIDSRWYLNTTNEIVNCSDKIALTYEVTELVLHPELVIPNLDNVFTPDMSCFPHLNFRQMTPKRAEHNFLQLFNHLYYKDCK